jgi:hypothetical protein
MSIINFFINSKQSIVKQFENFSIKIEKDDQDQMLSLLFQNDKEKEINVPEGIKVEQIDLQNRTKIKSPIPGTQIFLIFYPRKYIISYQNIKILELTCDQKRYFINKY